MARAGMYHYSNKPKIGVKGTDDTRAAMSTVVNLLGGFKAASRKLKASESFVRQMTLGSRVPNLELARDIEKATDGRISARRLRPSA